MLVIGLTGNIASGKTSVARIWRSLGAVVIDADRIGHTILSPGSAALKSLVEIFGRGVLTGSELDRKKLAAIVFESREMLQKLNGLLHPLIGREILRRIEEERLAGTSVVVVDAALIFEAGTRGRYDLVVVVDSPLRQRLARLREERGMSEERAMLIESTQMDPGEKVERGDFVIENSGTAGELENASKALYIKILKDFKAKNKGVDER